MKNEASIPAGGGGAELTVAAMDPWSRLEIGRKTLQFVKGCMRDPALRAKIQARAEQLRRERERMDTIGGETNEGNVSDFCTI